ncbi:MAG: ATP synthase F1 subunit delta [Chloroherpetonaceae bacterium]|nr:ATP synthase F1 subunit delta [Chloroherpetonaceae bacterium]
MKSLVGRRYASAIFEFAIETNSLSQFSEDFATILESLKNSRQLAVALQSPIIKNFDKVQIFTQLFQNKISPATLNSLKLIIEKDRAAYIESVSVEFFHLLDEKNGLIEVEVKSAISLNDVQLNALMSKLESMTMKKIRPKVSSDSSLIGGFTVRIGDTVIDGSIKRKLEQLRESFLNAPLN